MSKLLVINSSPFLEGSKTRELVSHIVPRYLAKNPDTEVVERDLAVNPLPHIDGEMIASYYTDPAERSDAQKAAIATSEALVDELEAASAIIIAAPMHNFGITSGLKAYIDHIARAGRTFRYTANGPEGLLGDKKVYLVCASGGSYGAESPYHSLNHLDTYLKVVMGFIGLTDVTVISAEGMSSSDQGLLDAKAQIDALLG